MKHELKQIAKQAINLTPLVKWIAQDPDDGDWYAYEVEPIFSFAERFWIPARTSGYIYICTEKVLPDELVMAYEISTILADDNN